MNTVDSKYILTKEGLDRFIEELRLRKTETRDSIATKIAVAAAQGDLSENAAYSAAMEEKDLNESKISDLEDIITNAVIAIKNNKNNKVDMGDFVEVKDGKKKVIYQIVSEDEANPKEFRIGVGSPVGKALIGKSLNDIVVVKLPIGEKSLEIISIK